VGGGFIIVPTLHSISNLETKMIVATSLAVIALVSMANAFSYAGNGTILWSIAVPFVSATVVGMGIVDFPHYGRHRYSLIKHSGGNDVKGTICGRV
jgi:hypothetical protein